MLLPVIALALTMALPLAHAEVPTAAADEKPADTRPKYRLKTDHPSIGSRIRDDFATGSSYPLDRPYGRFTDQEKSNLRSEYEEMLASDEPPFPVHGMAPLIEEISIITGRLRMEGVVHIHVTVDSTGNATKVALVKHPNIETAKAVAYVLVKAKYKPAVCSGQPCTMDFPFRVELQRQ